MFALNADEPGLFLHSVKGSIKMTLTAIESDDRTNEIVELNGEELHEVAGGPQEENIPRPR